MKNKWDSLGGPVVKNLPAKAKDTGFNPRSGKIPQAAELTNPMRTTTEAPEPLLHRRRSRFSEKPAHHT